MQALEAMLSLAFFLMISSTLLPAPHQAPVDSLYRFQLAEDAWRILFLRGAFEDFGEPKRALVERELSAMGNATGLCYFIDGTEYTNCRGGSEGHLISVSMQRTVVSGGIPKKITFSMGK